MDTNYKLTATHIDRARSMALMLAAKHPGFAANFAIQQAIRHPDDSLAGTFWQRVAIEAESLELLCCQPA